MFPAADDSDTSEIELSIVVPLYNECESVGPLLKAIEETYQTVVDQRWEVILIDDGSTDGTFDEAVHHATRGYMPTEVIRLQRNFGQTAAMQAGIDASSGELIATLDGDLQNDPADIPRMVSHLRQHDLDLLVGRRRNRQDGLFLRLIPSWIANRVIARVTGVQLHDYGCSLKVYRTVVVKQIRLMGEMHRFIPAWMAAVTQPSRISEIDVKHRARQFGVSKYGISRTLRVLLDLISVLFFMKYRARPGHFFGMLGMAVGALGTVMLGIVFVAKYGLGQDIGTRPMLLIGGFAMLSSLQLICFGVMAEMLSRLTPESMQQSTYLVRDRKACGPGATPLRLRKAA